MGASSDGRGCGRGVTRGGTSSAEASVTASVAPAAPDAAGSGTTGKARRPATARPTATSKGNRGPNGRAMADRGKGASWRVTVVRVTVVGRNERSREMLTSL